MSIDKKVFAHILLHNSFEQHGATAVQHTLASLLAQKHAVHQLVVSDNASTDGGIAFLQEKFVETAIEWKRFEENVGFSAGQNWAAKKFLDSDCEFFLILNPDCALSETALSQLVAGFEESQVGMTCPKLLRASSNDTIDAAGMIMNMALRHLDRGSGQYDRGQYESSEFVFGGSGACLLLSRACVLDICLPSNLKHQEDVYLLYPQLAQEQSARVDLFDEAFFAYREDADLCWRALLFNWKCRYVPSAIGYHGRVVLPERRASLPKEYNLYGVRNRFLLQLNNFFVQDSWRATIQGVLFRNMLVCVAVILVERSSFSAFLHCKTLFRRALARRRYIRRKSTVSQREVFAGMLKKSISNREGV